MPYYTLVKRLTLTVRCTQTLSITRPLRTCQCDFEQLAIPDHDTFGSLHESLFKTFDHKARHHVVLFRQFLNLLGGCQPQHRNADIDVCLGKGLLSLLTLAYSVGIAFWQVFSSVKEGKCLHLQPFPGSDPFAIIDFTRLPKHPSNSEC